MGRGYESTIYSWTGEDTWTGEFDQNKIRIVPIGGPKRIASMGDAFRFAKAWLRLRKALKRDRIQILHTHDFLPSLVGRTASLAARVPYRVITLHNLYEWWPSWAFRLNRILARRTDAITCVSESVKRFMVLREGLPADRYRTILNGVDQDRFRPDPVSRTRLREELGILDHEILIGSVGSITTRKAQWILAQAVAGLLAKGLPIQVRIWGLSSANPQHAEREVLELVGRLGIGDKFRLLPPRRDIERVYNAMDIHCMTSVAEGLSLASVEAMMCGIVPVYSDIGPFKEVVTDGENGFLFESGSPAALEKVLERCIGLFRDGSLAQTGANARQTASSRFSMRRVLEEWSALYSSLNRRP